MDQVKHVRHRLDDSVTMTATGLKDSVVATGLDVNQIQVKHAGHRLDNSAAVTTTVLKDNVVVVTEVDVH